MAILKPLLAIAALLITAQGQNILQANEVAHDPTPVLEKRGIVTNCASNYYDDGDYQSALNEMVTWLGNGQDIGSQDYVNYSVSTAQVYICNNENYHDVGLDGDYFTQSMQMLDAGCGVGIGGWIREQRHDIDVSTGRDNSYYPECGS